MLSASGFVLNRFMSLPELYVSLVCDIVVHLAEGRFCQRSRLNVNLFFTIWSSALSYIRASS